MQNELIQHYAVSGEDQRLTRQNITRLEFNTTIHCLSKYVEGKKNLTELGAATGRYSLYYAKQGYDVTAVELVTELVKVLKSKAEEDSIHLSIHEGNAKAVPFIPNSSQDLVLILGPLYHIQNIEDRLAVISEANRILKKGGVVAIAYISRYFVAGILAKLAPELVNPSVLSQLNETGLVTDNKADTFLRTGYFATPHEVERLATKFGLTIKEHLATDGFGRYIGAEINAFDEDKYQNWLQYHLSTCREPSLLGSSNHGLVIAKK